MLILTRAINESIVIGDNIKVTIVSVGGDVVKIAVKVPKNIEVHGQGDYCPIENKKTIVGKS